MKMREGEGITEEEECPTMWDQVLSTHRFGAKACLCYVVSKSVENIWLAMSQAHRS